jgi:hypothetical protein
MMTSIIDDSSNCISQSPTSSFSVYGLGFRGLSRSIMFFTILKENQTMNTIVDDGSIGRSFGFLSKS